ncbi:MAG: hypothetical protein GY925_07990 [Actinomycetia bacterium]|nr:hypothetical protein [Actinomycetes bacterium]
MAIRHEQQTDEQQRRQDALDRSWAAAQRDRGNPAFVELLRESLARVNALESTATMTGDEFLAQTAPPSE